MQINQKLWALFRIALPMIALAVICLGAFLLSITNIANYKIKLIFAYILIACGLLVLLAGIFWSVYHGMRQKSFIQNVLHPRRCEVHINTVDRPDFYPPSYEESVGRNPEDLVECVVIDEEQRCNIPPPLYTENSSDIREGVYNSEEQPPSYKESMLQSNRLGDRYTKESVKPRETQSEWD
ncbi:transmembrane protein 252-like [Polyodon spathula]|uniref:transmembrane protein 252-like n=1 Tax=Polyodon spathula TaxID=7913 RepID=UPI001B7F5535|nr:transmembrane protein 252-like [Polyodon spathula]